MQIREFQESDKPLLKTMHTSGGLEYEFPDLDSPLIEEILVIVDANDRLIAASIARRIPEMLLICDRTQHPLVLLDAIELTHNGMRARLQSKGYREAFALIGPKLKSYARHLVRKFGWYKEYDCYKIRG